jgi:predicted AlkP superfamily pyrophosphatase or phosphodiesterase
LPTPEPGARPEHLALVSIAGFTPERYGASGPALMPSVVGLARAGVEADVVQPVAPASIYPAHATLVTGELPAQHGVPADRLLGERGVRRTRYWHASHLEAPTLWQRAHEADLVVAAFDWPSTVGATIDLLVPDIEPVRRSESWPELLADTATPWLAERVAVLSGGAAQLAAWERDSLLVTLACEVLQSPSPPQLLLLRLSQTREALARFGPGSPEAQAAFTRADAELARLLTCYEVAGFLSRAAIAVVGDGGSVPVHTRVNPNVALARAGLAPGGDSVLSRWRAIARSNGGSAFVYAQRDADALGARRSLEAAAESTRAFRVVSARELLELGSDPEAWFGLEATPGFDFGNRTTGPLLEPASVRGASGYLPQRAEMAPGFVLWGRGVRAGVRVPWMRQSDVAPTLAQLLGVALESQDGRVLVGALEAPLQAPPARAKRAP